MIIHRIASIARHAPHGDGASEALRPCLQPHPQGRPHHRRPGRLHIAEAIGYRNLDRGDWAERGI